MRQELVGGTLTIKVPYSMTREEFEKILDGDLVANHVFKNVDPQQVADWVFKGTARLRFRAEFKEVDDA